MSSEHQPTQIVKGSNIGFVFGILLVVALGMYLFRSGFMADKFGLSKPEPTPTPTPTTFVEIEEEPITLLEDENSIFDLTEDEDKEEVAEITTHKPVDTAIGDNPMYLILVLILGAGITAYTSKRLA